YSCQTLDDIIALPVDQLMAPDAAIFLWVVQPMYPEAMRVLTPGGSRIVPPPSYGSKCRSGGTNTSFHCVSAHGWGFGITLVLAQNNVGLPRGVKATGAKAWRLSRSSSRPSASIPANLMKSHAALIASSAMCRASSYSRASSGRTGMLGVMRSINFLTEAG